jgi:hypothetical protein
MRLRIDFDCVELGLLNRFWALKEPNMNNPRRQPGVACNISFAALKELNIFNYGKNLSSGVLPDSKVFFLTASEH